MRKFLLIFIIMFPHCFGVNIAKQFMNDTQFKKIFIRKFGNVAYDLFYNQIKTWYRIKGFQNLNSEDLDILFTMYIPEKKKTISLIEKLIHQNNKKNNNETLKKNQFMIRLYKKYNLFYSNYGMIWHVKNFNIINNCIKKPIYKNHNIPLKNDLIHHITHCTVLDKENIDFFHQNVSNNNEKTLIMYGLIYRNYNKKKKLQNLLSYPLNKYQINLIKILNNNHFNKSFRSVLQEYKKINNVHDHTPHEILILTTGFIIANRKNTKITPKEIMDILKILLEYYKKVLEDFHGIGISLFFKTIKILLQKIISQGILITHKNIIKNFFSFFKNNDDVIIQWIENDIINPYFHKYFSEINNNNLNIYINIIKKHHSPKVGYIVEFLAIFCIINIVYENYWNVIRWAPLMYVLSCNNHQYHHEQSIYYLVLSYIMLINDNKDPINNDTLKKNLEFWINQIKTAGQVSLYGQFISDKFCNHFRKKNYCGLYLHTIYNNQFPNTLEIDYGLNNLNGQDFKQKIQPYDWLMILGTYVLFKENIDISLGETVTKNDKVYRKIHNNPYSISKETLYGLDYILNILPRKSFESINFFNQLFFYTSLKKYRYMSMIGDCLENKTGVINCFNIHPKNHLLMSKDQEKYLTFLSAHARKETGFTLNINKKQNNFFDPDIGSGLFQINKSNAQKVCKALKTSYNKEMLYHDIKYNFQLFFNFYELLTNWLKKKHIFNWIISYNASTKNLQNWKNLLILYNIPIGNQDGKELFGPLTINLIPININRNYTLHVISYINNNNYFLMDKYFNMFSEDINDIL